MPNQKKSVLPVLGLIFALSFTTSSQAFSLFGGGGGFGGIVYDPTNHLETAVSAAESVKQTTLQVRAEIQRLQQLAAEVEQLKSLPQDVIQSTLKDSFQQISVLQQGSALMSSLSSEIEGVKQLYSARLREMAALGLSPHDYVQYEAKLAQLNHQSQSALIDQDQQVLAGVQNSIARLSNLQAQIPASSGVHQSMQTTNQYLDLLAGQTTQLLQLTASQASANNSRLQLQDSNAADAQAREAARVQSDLSNIQTLRQQLRQREAQTGWGLMRPLSMPAQ